MSSMKKVISLIISLTMIVSLITFTCVSAADGETIYEDFEAGFTISESGIETNSGLTVTAHANVLANAKFVTSDKGLYVPGGGSNNTADGLASSEDKKGVNFAFDPITEGTAEISFDLTIVNGGYSHPSTLGVLYGVDAEDAETAVISHKFWTATNATSATTGDVAGHSLFFGDGGYDSSVKVTNEANEKIRATYVINMTDRTVDVLVNGTSIGTRTFRTAATSVSEIRFYDDYNCASYIIDNLTIASDATAAQKTITFDGAADPIALTYGRLVTLPTLEVEGKIFKGWADAQGNIVDNTFIVTEDMALTASFRNFLAIKEDFGDNFSIDYNAKTITSNSGFTFSSTTDGAWNTTYGIKNDSNGLTVPYNSGNTPLADVYIKFPGVKSGKLYLSFNLYNRHTSNGHTANRTFFKIGDSEKTEWAATLSTVSSSEGTPISQFKTGDGAILSEGSIEYLIDLDNNTYTIKSGGVQIGETHTLTDTEKIDSIYLTTTNSAHYCAPFAIDNITIIENPEINNKTIKFMNGDAVYSNQTVAVFENAIMPETNPQISGKIFLGWFDKDGNKVTEEMLTNITADATYYASFREAVVLREDFENFAIDNTNKTITTDSNITVTAGEAFYALNPTANGALSARAYTNGNGVTGDMSMTFKFPAISGGKVKLAFDLAIPETGFSNWMAVHGKPYFTAGNSETGKNAAALYVRGINGTNTRDTEVYLATANGSNGSATNTIGTINGRSSDLANIEYIIDMDAKTYSVTWGGQTYSDIAFASDATSIDNFTIAFATDGIRNQNCDIIIDNLTIVENPDNSDYTVTFMNGSEVYNTQTVAVFGDVTMPETEPNVSGKIFTGWETADGAEVTAEMLTNITANATYYAKYRSLVDITEDFSSATVDSANKTMTGADGLTYALDYSAADGINTSNIFSITSNGTFKIARGTEGNDYHSESAKMNFTKLTDGIAYLAFDIKIPDLAYGGHHKGREVARITDGEGNTVSSLWIDKGESGYYGWLEVGKNMDGAEDDSTIAKLGAEFIGVHNFVTIEYVIDIEAKTYTVSVNGAKAKTFDFESDSVTGVSQLEFNTAADGTYHYRMTREIDNITIIEGYEAPVPEIPNEIDGEFDATGCAEKVLADGEVVTINGVLKNGIIDARLGSVVIGATTMTGRITFNADGEVDAEVGDTVKMVKTLTEDFIYGDKNYGQGIVKGFVQKTPITASTKKYTMILTANGTDGNGNTYTNKTREVPFEIKDNTFEGNARFRAIVTGVPEGVTIEAAYGVAE